MAWKIGVDGGATKTECILVDPDGRIAARHVVAGCNPNVIGPAKAEALVREAMHGVLAGRGAGEVSSTLLCMAGHRPFWNRFAAGLAGFGRASAADDSLPVLELATRGGPGLVLHAGTGSFVAGRGPDGEARYAGGLGWRFGDEGSGYDLGRRAIAHTLLELQGWAASSGLGALVAEKSGLTDQAAISGHFYGQASPNAEIAALAPGVLKLAHAGDEAAAAAVADSVGSFGRFASGVAARLFPNTPPSSVPAGVSGPILNHPAAFPVLAAHSRLLLVPVSEPPIEGLRLLLIRGAAA